MTNSDFFIFEIISVMDTIFCNWNYFITKQKENPTQK